MKLRSGTAALRRGEGGLALGADPRHRFVLRGLDAREERWLRDVAASSAPGGDTEAGPACPVPPGGARIRAMLSSVGLIEAAQSRRRRSILVDGVDEVTWGAICMLAEVADLKIDFRDRRQVDAPLDQQMGGGYYGCHRGPSARRALAVKHPKILVGRSAVWDAALVSRERVVDHHLCKELCDLQIPHVLVIHDEVTTVVGPLVVPGYSPCGHCLELARADADPFHPADRWELESWPLGPLAPARRHQGILQVARALAAAAGLDELGSGDASEWTRTLAQIDEDGRVEHIHLQAHTRCPCGASGALALD